MEHKDTSTSGRFRSYEDKVALLLLAGQQREKIGYEPSTVAQAIRGLHLAAMRTEFTPYQVFGHD